MSTPTLYHAFVSAPKGLQYALEQELQTLGIKKTKAVPAGVEISASIADVYRALLWSRIANRLVVDIDSGPAGSADELYATAKSIDWAVHLKLASSFAVDFHGAASWLNNSTFGALKVKDAIVDQFREATGERPSVSRDTPDLRIAVRLRRGQAVFGLDLSGDSLHRRGYRQLAGKAPLKENLAAGMLWLAGWRTGNTNESTLLDPMCGSATLLIEGAMIALDKAPGLLREYWGFKGWKLHDEGVWQQLVTEAESRYESAQTTQTVRCVGFDEHAPVVKKAWQNIEAAGLEKYIHVEKRALEDFVPSEKWQPGLVISNPPYGERLGEQRGLRALYANLGAVFDRDLMGWKAAVLTGNAELGRHIAWRSHKQYKLFNGALESLLLLFNLEPENRHQEAWQSQAQRLADPAQWRIAQPERAAMLANRIQKNTRTIGKWAKQQGISCFRLYDADMPEYAFALDIYEQAGGERHLHVQEYMPPKSLPDKVAFERLSEALKVISDSLSVPGERIYLKRRQRQKGIQQYEKHDRRKEFFTVAEYDALLRVNLRDYLDTGLFLDHRPIRRWMHEECSGKKVLNLFCYTAAVTVHAALGGASATTSIDMSKTYLDWARQNFELNHIEGDRHQLVHADCLEWLSEASSEQYDVIFLDPPSFSNSKRMEGVLDIQRDHADMIRACMQRLAKGGTLVFSNNLQKFVLANELEQEFVVKDWHANSLDKDFERNPKIHHCWLFRQR